MTLEEQERLAARIEQRTDRILKTSGLMFLAWQASYFAIFNQPHHPLRAVDIVASAGYVAWAAALLMLIATGGGLFRTAEVREILDDERARLHRASAYRNGFWTMLVVALAAYVAAQVTELSAALLAHVSLSSGVLAAVTTLVYLRRG